MSKRNKLVKFAELLTFPHVFENFDTKKPALSGRNGERVELKGQWCARHFDNDHPLVLELACGKGDYSLGLARQFPDKNFVGVDIKGARIWKGAKQALEEGLDNVAFLRTRIELITHFFAAEEVNEIWITFPDPFPRKSKANRRLTAPIFLNLYRQILKKGGLVHLKTDATGLYEYTLETLATLPNCKLLYHNDDIYASSLASPELAIKTFYEKIHLANGKAIKYVSFVMG